MNSIKVWMVGMIVASGTVLGGRTVRAVLTTNNWSDSSSKWELGANWSAGTPSLSNAINFVSSGFPVGPRTITIDVATVSSNVINGCLTISNLVVGGTAFATDTLFLNNANNTPGNIGLTILNTLTISSHASLSITNSRLRVGLLGTSLLDLVDDSVITLNTGSVVTSNNTTAIGFTGGGTLNILDGTWSSIGLEWTYLGYNSGSVGTLNMSGGTATFAFGGLTVGYGYNAMGNVWLTGGQLITDEANIGYGGIGQMTVSNGTWLAGNVAVGLFSGSQGTLTVAGGSSVFNEVLVIGNDVQTTGTVWLTGGQLAVTNAETLIGAPGVGQMTVSNGMWRAADVYVGHDLGSQGTLTVAGGTNLLSLILDIGTDAGATGAVWMSGGELIVTNGGNGIGIGDSGVGQMTISNGTCQTPAVFVAYTSTSQGTLSIDGGNMIVRQQRFIAGDAPGATGTVWMTGGQLITTNFESDIGDGGVGQFTISNGTWRAASVIVADFDNSEGTLSVGGGSASMTNLVLGDCAVDAQGFLVVKGGGVYVTNATHTAVLDVRDGWVIVTGGLLMVDKLVMTNECGLIFHGGGTVLVGSSLLDPNLDADDDGLPNGWEQAHGLDPLSSLGNDGPDGDPDHDGFTNLEEYEAGTDPQDPNSNPLRITSIVHQGNDMLLTWTTAGGKTNVVQATGGASGNYSNSFADLSPVIVPGGDGLTSSSYTDVGGATNIPARYYRIRLAP